MLVLALVLLVLAIVVITVIVMARWDFDVFLTSEARTPKPKIVNTL